jgi:putative transposase
VRPGRFPEAAFLAVFEQYGKSYAKAMQILECGYEDACVLCLSSRALAHERINEEIRRRTRVVGIFPNVAFALRLIGILLLEQTEGWLTDKR